MIKVFNFSEKYDISRLKGNSSSMKVCYSAGIKSTFFILAHVFLEATGMNNKFQPGASE